MLTVQNLQVLLSELLLGKVVILLLHLRLRKIRLVKGTHTRHFLLRSYHKWLAGRSGQQWICLFLITSVLDCIA